LDKAGPIEWMGGTPEVPVKSVSGEAHVSK